MIYYIIKPLNSDCKVIRKTNVFCQYYKYNNIKHDIVLCYWINIVMNIIEFSGTGAA